MLTKVLKVCAIDEAVEKILNELKEDAAGTARGGGGKRNVIYFDGWDGLGASAVLRAVSRRLTPEAESSRATPAASLEFSRIFHIDCSKWESRRAMQRMVAKQLELPASVMEMFDAQDEEEDYQGVRRDSRAEIPLVAEEINQQIRELNRFLLIFHNGSSEEIDLGSIGFPQFDQYSRSKVLWSFQGRFRAYPRRKVDEALKNIRKTNVFLSAASSDIEEEKILFHEAEEVAREMINAGGGVNWHEAAAKCFLYMMELCRMGNDFVDYGLRIHVCNYWRCDGIIQLQQGDDGVDKLWSSSDALHREMRLDADHYKNPYFSTLVERCFFHRRMAYWTSPTYGVMRIPADEHIPRGMFQQLDKLLCVLKLSACTFSFTSPPFLCCHNVRFLWLDHCRDGSSSVAEAVKGEEEEDVRRFLQRLWVLDVRYSNKAFLSMKMMGFMTQLRELNVMGEDDWVVKEDMLQGRLMNNIRKLRVTNSCGPSDGSRIFVPGMDKLEQLEISGNRFTGRLDVQSGCSDLETVVIRGPNDFGRISLSGCAKLKNLFLSGSFPNLGSIVIAGAVVEILDLRAVTAPNLATLHLIGCEKLCAILWPLARAGRFPGWLRIDTTKKEGSSTAAGEHAGNELDWHISVRDARILGSLEPVKKNLGRKGALVEIEIFSSPCHHPSADAGGSKDGGMWSSSGQHVPVKLKQLLHQDTAVYSDVDVTLKDTSMQQLEANEEGDTSDASGIMWTCPPPPDMASQDCYIHIEDPISSSSNRTKSRGIISLPGFICDAAKILHVHDSLHVTSIHAAPAFWNKLEWCRVERCPELGYVFSPEILGDEEEGYLGMFEKLRTAWISHLPKARYIWNWTGTSVYWLSGRTFRDLTLLHLDFCPRITHVAHFPISRYAFESLETLEIRWCGDLSVAFLFYDTPPGTTGWGFVNLKHVRLHELPKLRNIFNIGWRVVTPKLETIKIRGCWSLRTLPIVYSNNMVVCDCEKEWWDMLEWESPGHSRKYKPIHPRYYKKTILRSSVLR